jgi:hypothetical protein
MAAASISASPNELDVEKILSKLTLEEKVSLTAGKLNVRDMAGCS